MSWSMEVPDREEGWERGQLEGERLNTPRSWEDGAEAIRKKTEEVAGERDRGEVKREENWSKIFRWLLLLGGSRKKRKYLTQDLKKQGVTWKLRDSTGGKKKRGK